MSLNATLLAMLACPSDDHAPLREESLDGVDTLICSYCATRYPIDDGIPVLLLDDATPGPNGVGIAAPLDAADPALELPVPAEPEAAVQPDGPLTVGDLGSKAPLDPSHSPKHALPETVAAETEVVDDVVTVDEAVVEAEVHDDEVVIVVDEPVVVEVPVDEVDEDDEDEVAAESPAAATPTDPRRPQTTPPGARSSRASELRNRVQQRLAELEANRGPRMRRRGSGR